MISASIALPHPVLGRAEDYQLGDDFPLTIKVVDSDENTLGLALEGYFDQIGILELLAGGYAEFGLEIYCGATMSRNWVSVDLAGVSQKGKIDLDMSNLARTVEITPLIICLAPVKSNLSGASSFYDEMLFSLLPGDVLGQGATMRILIDDEQHTPNLMSFQKSGDVAPGEYQVSIGAGLIVAMGYQCWDLFSRSHKDSRLKPLMFMSIVKDALVYGLQNLEDGQEDELTSWREGLSKKLEELGLGQGEGELDDWQQANLIAQKILAKNTVSDFLAKGAQVEDSEL